MNKLVNTWNFVITAIVVLTAVGFVGCTELTITPDQLQTLATQTEQLSSKIDDFQLQSQTAIEAMKTNGTVDVNALAKVDKLQSSIDAVQVKAQSIAQAVKNAQYTNPADMTTTVIEGTRAANAASIPWNPYAPLIDLGLGIVAAAAAVIAKRNAQAAAAAQAKYQAHKQGVELTMKQVSQSADTQVRAIETQLYENIGNARIAVGVNQ